MFKTTAETDLFCQQFINLPRVSGCEVVIFPPFTSLSTVRQLMTGRGVTWGGQNVHPAANGAFTGEISAGMLAEVGCTWVLIGHSERRHIFKEADDFLAQKVTAVLQAGLKPNICVGETLSDREAERTNAVVGGQLRSALARVSAEDLSKCCVSYEPVWAIGTGKNATGVQAQETCAFIRSEVARAYSPEKAAALQILYGGSVKPENIAEFSRQSDVDGALIGGASLDANSFHRIITSGIAS
jgi:triosephosphate isomerase